MVFKSPIRWFYFLVLALLLTGCVTAPQTPRQSLSYVDGEFTAAVNTASDLRDAGILTPPMVAKIDPLIQRGNQALDMAWTALGSDTPQSALGYVRVVNNLLLELNKQLQEAKDARGH